MKTLFKAITAQLDTIPELKWVDEDKGQMNFERPPILFPAALVTIALPRTRNLTDKKQDTNALISVKLCFDYSGETSMVTPTVARDKSLGYYDIVEKVYKALQGFSTENFNPLVRNNVQPLPRPDGYKTTVIPFTTEFLDFSAAEV